MTPHWGGRTLGRQRLSLDQRLSTHARPMSRQGDVDLIVGNYNQANQLFLNDGSGSFGSSVTLPSGGTELQTCALAFGDVDGDASRTDARTQDQ